MMFPKPKFNGKFSAKSKYRETKSVRPGGLSFASKLEASVYDMLYMQERTGQIKIEKIQAHVYLTDARILCIPDFLTTNLETGELEWVEAKGFSTDRFLIIKRLWEFYGPGKLKIYKGSYKKIFLAETIIPKKPKQLFLSTAES